MDLYNNISTLVGWEAIVAVLLVIGGVGYWLMQHRINMLKDDIERLNTKKHEAEKFSPDILAKRLAERHKLALEEIEKLKGKKDSDQEIIGLREIELSKITKEINTLHEQIENAQEYLEDEGLVCPHCGSFLEFKEYHLETVFYGGRDVDVDHEYYRYQCGFVIADSNVLHECPNKEN